jgi:monoamine oxidase
VRVDNSAAAVEDKRAAPLQQPRSHVANITAGAQSGDQPAWRKGRVALPIDRSFLHQRMPSGAIVKISVVYDAPFCRADGLSGQTASPGSVATLTIDACTDTGTPVVMCVLSEGPAARRLGRLAPADPQAAVVGELVDRFGDKASSPVRYHEQDWSVERYSGGGMISHAPTGVLTEFGYTLREPCGRIHWAGTEGSAVMRGWVDGAIRSGERAAEEVPARETAAAIEPV